MKQSGLCFVPPRSATTTTPGRCVRHTHKSGNWWHAVGVALTRCHCLHVVGGNEWSLCDDTPYTACHRGNLSHQTGRCVTRTWAHTHVWAKGVSHAGWLSLRWSGDETLKCSRVCVHLCDSLDDRYWPAWQGSFCSALYEPKAVWWTCSYVVYCSTAINYSHVTWEPDVVTHLHLTPWTLFYENWHLVPYLKFMAHSVTDHIFT